MRSIIHIALILGAWARAPTYGEYETGFKIYQLPRVRGDSGHYHVYYPKNAPIGEKFPLIAYAHGLAGGGIDILGYAKLFAQMASFGFVIVAPNTCMFGCADKVKSPYTDCNQVARTGKNPEFPGSGWNTWFGEQLKAIEWARNQTETADPIFKLLDTTVGTAIAGHSMGGQATAWSAHANCTSQWNIVSAAVHHSVPATTNAEIGVPMGAFGSTWDDIISTKPTREIFAQSPVYPKMWRYVVGSSHLEPVLLPPFENPLLATYTVAWFKVTMKQDPHNYWHGLIFNKTSPDYICTSQKMKECAVDSSAHVTEVIV